MTLSKVRVLVVEDHPDSRLITVLAMEKWGYEVVEARDGREALAQLESGDFNLVVIDIAIPFVSGREVAKSIKNNPETKHIPLLAVTALDTSENRKMCAAAGLNDFLAKPFSMESLKAKVGALLAQSNPQ
jgi:CheY-like chemotaxis protein